MAGTAVSPALPAAAVPPPAKRRRRPRLLPEFEDRRAISVNINHSVDVKLEILTALDGRMKNDLVLDSLREFLRDRKSSCEPVHESRSGAKVRVTFILNRELDALLNSFVESHKCTNACAVTAALARYFNTHYRIDLLKTPSRERIIQALRG